MIVQLFLQWAWDQTSMNHWTKPGNIIRIKVFRMMESLMISSMTTEKIPILMRVFDGQDLKKKVRSSALNWDWTASPVEFFLHQIQNTSMNISSKMKSLKHLIVLPAVFEYCVYYYYPTWQNISYHRAILRNRPQQTRHNSSIAVVVDKTQHTVSTNLEVLRGL